MQLTERFFGQPWHISPQMVPILLQRRAEWAPRLMASAPTQAAPSQLTIADFIHQRQPLTVTSEGLAIIEACGALARGLVTVDKLLGDTDYDDLIEEFSQAVENNKVRAIVFAIDSGGGSVVGAQECREAIAAAAAQKPVVVITHGMMCSAAYEIAAGASFLIASPSAIVGSIGTIQKRLDITGYYEQFGVKVHVTTATGSDLKATYHADSPLSEAEAAEIQRFVDRWNEDFRSWIRAQRMEVTDDTMRGQCFDAREGVSLGLIDGLGNFDDACREALAMAEPLTPSGR